MATHYREPPRAVLGPTNTGKTHFAIERMLGHPSGMIGFPLRLLARENYERVVRAKGPEQVALITGEEKIVPARARYFLCTVESMPLEREVAFLAVDEIQLAADPDRGHTFTDRLLHARGARETVFLGADTIGPLVRRLLPDVAVDTRPRLSALRHSGYKNIVRLPARTAAVAFSAADVYAIAELMRRQKGGAAVVLGALSPRTRNAQVALYQAGEVDTLVATDAIGMGLNLDLNHVAFAALAKFDGRRRRTLGAAEIGQIAGRAGRYTNDGSFGVTAEARPLDPALVEQLESHSFAPLTFLYWRNTQLRFHSVEALLEDLRRPAPAAGLRRPRAVEDERALEFLARDPEVQALLGGPERVRLLWDVCRIPDFRKLHTDAHPRLLGQIFRHLCAGEGTLPVDWVADQVRRLARSDGDIEVLTRRIAGIRTWTYIAHGSRWLPDPRHWQEHTRAVEDRLSDALHEQLTRRFVDRRTALLVQSLKASRKLQAAVARDGAVSVEGHFLGRLEGFRLHADDAGDPRAARAVRAAAAKALAGAMPERVAALCAAEDGAFALTASGAVCWEGAPVGQLRAGADVLHPLVEPPAEEWLAVSQREAIRRRLHAWFEDQRARWLGRLLAAEQEAPAGAVRGLLFQLGQGLGSVTRQAVCDQLETLSRNERRQLQRVGVRIGRHSVYLPALLKPGAVALRGALWAVWSPVPAVPSLPPAGATVVGVEEGAAEGFYEALGYRVCGTAALRLDVLERVAGEAWKQSTKGPFPLQGELLSVAGCTRERMLEVLHALGYRTHQQPDGEVLVERREARARRRAGGQARPGRAARRRPRTNADSPFAALAELKRGRKSS